MAWLAPGTADWPTMTEPSALMPAGEPLAPPGSCGGGTMPVAPLQRKGWSAAWKGVAHVPTTTRPSPLMAAAPEYVSGASTPRSRMPTPGVQRKACWLPALTLDHPATAPPELLTAEAADEPLAMR